MKYKLTAEESSTLLQQQTDFPFILMMKHGKMTVEYFAPKEIDTQTPHKQDEIYVIIKVMQHFCGITREQIARQTMFYLYQPA